MDHCSQVSLIGIGNSVWGAMPANHRKEWGLVEGCDVEALGFPTWYSHRVNQMGASCAWMCVCMCMCVWMCVFYNHVSV